MRKLSLLGTFLSLALSIPALAADPEAPTAEAAPTPTTAPAATAPTPTADAAETAPAPAHKTQHHKRTHHKKAEKKAEAVAAPTTEHNS